MTFDELTEFLKSMSANWVIEKFNGESFGDRQTFTIGLRRPKP